MSANLCDREVEAFYAVIHEQRAATQLLCKELKARCGSESERIIKKLKAVDEALQDSVDELVDLKKDNA